MSVFIYDRLLLHDSEAWRVWSYSLSVILPGIDLL